MSYAGPGLFQLIPDSAGVGASPGFSFGRSGNSSSNTYLSSETVPSNLTGIPVGIANGRITGVMIRNELANTFDIEVEEHDGVTFTSLGTFSVTSARGDDFFALNIPLTPAKELAVKVSSGSCKNVKVVLLVKGDAL